MNYKNVFFVIIIALISQVFYSCANIVPPSGGDKDTTPPKLLSMTPKDSLLNTKVKKIVLHFNKFVEVNNLSANMVLSPLLEQPPTVIANGKRVEIKIVDSLLKDNTTYKISLGKAITDNREKTPYDNFTYTFSTGNYFDSLRIKGVVLDALTGLPDTGVSVQLYPEPFKDSLLFSKRPMYVAITNGNGEFSFANLPDMKFKMFAISDEDKNRIFNRSNEKIGFLDSAINSEVVVDSGAKHYVLHTSLMKAQVSQKDSLKQDSLQRLANLYIGRVHSKAKNAKTYQVEVDTFAKEKGTFDIAKKLTIKLNAVLGKLDSSKVYLSYITSGGIEAQANTKILSDTGSLYLQHNWIPETEYTLRLVKGWATDSGGAELVPGKYVFKTKRLEDYAKLSIKVPDSLTGPNNILVMWQDKDTLYNKALTDSIVTLQLLNPGKCKMQIVIDENGNGKWDPGNPFTKEQPEKIKHHEAEVVLKAGWEHDVDFKPGVLNTTSSSDKKREKMGGIRGRQD